MKEKEKKAHGVQLLLRAVVRDPDGKVISDTRQNPARSFLIAFLQAVRGLLNPGNYLITDVDGVGWGLIDSTGLSGQFKINAPLNEGDYGIVVGTGDTAVTSTDIALETKIAQGTGAGTLIHGEVVVDEAGVVGANVDLEISRAFTNQSGGAITVKETGLYAEKGHQFCIIRDILPGPVDIPDMCSLTVYYTVRTTV